MHGLRSRDKAVTPRESVPPIGADTGDGAVDPDIPGILDMDRREAVRRYKETPRPAGVYQVVHKSSGRVLVGTSPDAPAMLRRIRTQLEMDSHPNMQLQHDWGVSGETGFVFEVVDLLDEPDSPTDDISREPEALNELW